MADDAKFEFWDAVTMSGVNPLVEAVSNYGRGISIVLVVARGAEDVTDTNLVDHPTPIDELGWGA